MATEPTQNRHRNVIYLADVLDSGTSWSVQQCLDEAAQDYFPTVLEGKPKKVLVLFLDNGPEGGDYNIAYTQAGMKVSEMLALAEVFSARCKRILQGLD